MEVVVDVRKRYDVCPIGRDPASCSVRRGCRYWDVEPRYVPIAEDRFTVTPDDVIAMVDENTIGVIPILGTTYTGEFDPIRDILRPAA